MAAFSDDEMPNSGEGYEEAFNVPPLPAEDAHQDAPSTAEKDPEADSAAPLPGKPSRHHIRMSSSLQVVAKGNKLVCTPLLAKKV